MAAEFALDVAAWLVTYALHSTALLLAALVAFALIQRAARSSPRLADAAPAWRDRIGKVALLAGIATASVQTALGIEPFGLRPALVQVSEPVVASASDADVASSAGFAPSVATMPALAIPDAHLEVQPLAAVPLYLVPVVGALRQAALLSEPAAEGAALPARVAARDPAPLVEDEHRSRWIEAFLAVWAIVACAAFARRFAGWRALSHSLANTEPVTDTDALTRFDDLCRRAGLRRSGPRAARLCVAPNLASPVTRGILVHEICLPPRALRDLDADEFTALLGHEIAHAARRDPAWLAVFRMLEVVLCLQPLNRVVARRLEDDAELLCDDRAVVWTGDRLPLASCLTEVASWLVPPAREPRLAVGMAAHGARLSRRVERLVDDGHNPDGGARRPLLTAAAILFAASAVAVVPGFAAQRSTKPLPFGLKVELALASSPTVGTDDSPDADPGTEVACEESPALEPGTQFDAEANAASTAPAAELPAVSANATLLAGVLDELEHEIAALREDLRERAGGAELEVDLDVLARRVGELRAREAGLVSSLESILAHTPNILLSPDATGRSAEDQDP